MKRIYAFSLMAFYLLLTTGMFVCIVDCAVHHTAATNAAKMTCSTMHCAKKQHGNYDCCKKHGTYLVKENIKPGHNIKLSQTAIYLQQVLAFPYLRAAVYVKYSFGLIGKAPPGRTGKFISIQYHSLQI